MALIKKDMPLGEVVQKHPETAEILFKNGLHCVGCHVSAYETIEQGARAHGMDDTKIDTMLEDMNKAAEKEKAD